MFVHQRWAGVNTIWDTMPREVADRGPNALRALIRGAMRERGIPSIDGERGLAKRAQVSRNTIYAWEAGAYPGVGEMEKVAQELGLPVWRLIQAWEHPGQYETAPAEAGAVQEILDLLRGSKPPAWADQLTNRITDEFKSLIVGPSPSLIEQVLARMEEILAKHEEPSPEAHDETGAAPLDGAADRGQPRS